MNGLKSKEIDLKTNKGGNNSGEVMFVRGRSQNRFQNHKPSNNHNQSSVKNIGKSKSRSKSRPKNRKCYNCGETDHYMKECSRPTQNQSQNFKNQHDDHANMASCSENMGDIFMVTEICDVSIVNSVHSSFLCENE